MEESLVLDKPKFDPGYPKSVYKEDFQIAHAKRPDPIKFEPDYSDIIAGPYLDPLTPDSKAQEVDQSKEERVDDFYKRLVKKYPTLKKVALPDEIDQSKVIEQYRDQGKSAYQADFCHDEVADGSFKPKGRKKIKLPEGPIPRSTYRRYYREWKNILPWDIEPARPFYPKESDLGMTWEEQRLLDVTTGLTEYQENIGECGQEIIDHAFYGEVKTLPHEFRRAQSKTKIKGQD